MDGVHDIDICYRCPDCGALIQQLAPSDEPPTCPPMAPCADDTPMERITLVEYKSYLERRQ